MSWYAVDYEHDRELERSIAWADACEEGCPYRERGECGGRWPGTPDCQLFRDSRWSDIYMEE